MLLLKVEETFETIISKKEKENWTNMIAHEVCLDPVVLCTIWNNEKFILVYIYKSPRRTDKPAMFSESINVVYLQIY